MTYSFAHCRLVLLYNQLEQLDRAEEHWLQFVGTFTDPDPEFQWMVDSGTGRTGAFGAGR